MDPVIMGKTAYKLLEYALDHPDSTHATIAITLCYACLETIHGTRALTQSEIDRIAILLQLGE